MIELIIIAIALIVLRRQVAALETGTVATLAPRRSAPALAQLTSYADRLYQERKWLAAEKAYLNVLKLDHKNVTAYSHLGIIYSTQKNLADAIECFEIATRLQPSANTFQNLGLGYLDNRNYIKAIATFEKAIMFEPSATRYLALSRAHHKLHNIPKYLAALEKVVELDPSKRHLQLLAGAYHEANRPADAAKIADQMRQTPPQTPPAA